MVLMRLQDNPSQTKSLPTTTTTDPEIETASSLRSIARKKHEKSGVPSDDEVKGSLLQTSDFSRRNPEDEEIDLLKQYRILFSIPHSQFILGEFS